MEAMGQVCQALVTPTVLWQVPGYLGTGPSILVNWERLQDGVYIDCELVQPLWKTVWWFFKKTKNRITI